MIWRNNLLISGVNIVNILSYIGQTVVGLVREFLDFFNLEFTQAVFEPESGCVSKLIDHLVPC